MRAEEGPQYQRLPRNDPDARSLNADAFPTITTTTTDPEGGPPQMAKVRCCPKLSRYKVAGAAFVVVVAILLVGITCLRRQRQPYMCLQPPSLQDPEAENKGNIMAHLRYSHTKRRLPQALVIGARKAGTRAVLDFLNIHSQITAAGREIHYFDKHFDKDLAWYRKQMPFSFKDQITVEKSPAYFVVPEVPERVYQMNASIKLILILRDPIDRAMSDYLQINVNKVKNHKPIIPFERLALDQETYEVNVDYAAISKSVYIRHLTRWLDYFPMEQIHIIDGDNMLSKPWEELAKVEDFLGLEHQVTQDRFYFNKTRGFYCFRTRDHDQCLASDKGRSHPDIDPYTLKQLINYFKPFNDKLFDCIGRKFHWRHWN